MDNKGTAVAAAKEKAIAALSGVARIDQRGQRGDVEIIFYHMLPDAGEGDDQRVLLEAAEEGGAITFELGNRTGTRYVLLRPTQTVRLTRLHIGLFLATVLTTLASGALMAGHDIFQSPAAIIYGWPFSLTLLSILGIHEYGHYYYGVRHKVDVSLPYFIPVPPPITLIGTFGAFIRMRGPMPNRLALLEIGAAGPIAGFIAAVPALLYGLSLSTVVPTDGSFGFVLGDSLLMKAGVGLIFPGLGPEQDILLHPVAFAGWIGLLVTMLNLLPLAQLDGGHIAYALLGERQVFLARVIFIALIPMGIFLSPSWLFWAFLILILMRTVRHPPVPDMDRDLTIHERRIGLVCVVIFILCFIPVPFTTS